MLGELRRCASPFVLRRCFHDARQYKEDIRWPGWQVIIGIETHAQIKSRQKLFSSESNSHLHPDSILDWTSVDAFNATLGEAPNTHVSPFDAAFPGTLPVS